MGDSTQAHPAKFSDSILTHIGDQIRELVEPPEDRPLRIIDPFAGVGLIHRLHEWGWDTYGVEIEKEWADCHPRTLHGDSLQVEWPYDFFDVMVTSPTYGNRMADHHNARDDSRRITYRHVLGRELDVNNSGRMQWGPQYRMLHAKVWEKYLTEFMRDGAWIFLNVKDHIRKGKRIPVTAWHRAVMREFGVEWVSEDKVFAPGMRMGENHEVRVDHESILVGRIKG